MTYQFKLEPESKSLWPSKSDPRSFGEGLSRLETTAFMLEQSGDELELADLNEIRGAIRLIRRTTRY